MNHLHLFYEAASNQQHKDLAPCISQQALIQQQQQKKKGIGGVMGGEEGGDGGPSHSPMQPQELSQQTLPLNGASINCTALKVSLEEHNLGAPIFLDICNELGAETVEDLAYATQEMLSGLLVKLKPIQLAKLSHIIKVMEARARDR